MAKLVNQFSGRVDECLACYSKTTLPFRVGSLVGLATCQERTERNAPTLICHQSHSPKFERDIFLSIQRRHNCLTKLRRLLLPIDSHSSTTWIIYCTVTVLLIGICTTPFAFLTLERRRSTLHLIYSTHSVPNSRGQTRLRIM